MAIAETFLPEFDHEMRITRALLERMPEAQAAWKPHPKSFSLGDLSAHLSNLPTWATAVLQHTEFDMGGPAAGGYTPRWESKAAMLEQLSVYLRLHDVPLPAMYGPSADSGS